MTAMVASETVRVPATLDGIRTAADAFEAFSATHALPARLTWRCLVALDEVLSNIVRHGGVGRESEVTLTFDLSEETLGVTISDSGGRFDPQSVPVPPAPRDLEHQSDGGRGLMLVRSLMDEVHYEWREKRNLLRIAVRLGTDR